MTRPILEVDDLHVHFPTPRGPVKAVDGVNFTLQPGERLGLIGESGSGKSTIALAVMRLIKPPGQIVDGRILLDGTNLLNLTDEEMRRRRLSEIALVTQGAMNSLNPVIRIRPQLMDGLQAHGLRLSKQAAEARLAELLRSVELEPEVADLFPHQLSGGMKQRVVAVISTLLDPRLLIADEPTSALDVSSQRVLIEMLREMLSQKIISGIIFITHDLPVLNTIADRVAIMYAGKIAEVGDTKEVIDKARHPYSASLLSAVLVPERQMRGVRVHGIPGSPPNLINPPQGCRFHPRCPLVMDVCRTEEPPQVGDEFRYSACWWADKHPGEPVEVKS
jgi:peptide/nickel transport system ATP-binding protein